MCRGRQHGRGGVVCKAGTCQPYAALFSAATPLCASDTAKQLNGGLLALATTKSLLSVSHGASVSGVLPDLVLGGPFWLSTDTQRMASDTAVTAMLSPCATTTQGSIKIGSETDLACTSLLPRPALKSPHTMMHSVACLLASASVDAARKDRAQDCGKRYRSYGAMWGFCCSRMSTPNTSSMVVNRSVAMVLSVMQARDRGRWAKALEKDLCLHSIHSRQSLPNGCSAQHFEPRYQVRALCE